ncbi:hypothetical protein DMH08_27650 [Actinomadura sp. WAC 06369]|nr:hypothetical protein DMH08_27650 [Actinomadura sp. WAC 06369]
MDRSGRKSRSTSDQNRPPLPTTSHISTGRRVILLTVFYKTQDREVAEIERAVRAMKVCQDEHGHARTDYIREV